MISPEARRLGMNERFPDDSVAHWREIPRRCALEIKLHRLAQIGDRFVARRAEAGDINIQALRDEIVLFAVNAVGDRFHNANRITLRFPQQRVGHATAP